MIKIEIKVKIKMRGSWRRMSRDPFFDGVGDLSPKSGASVINLINF